MVRENQEQEHLCRGLIVGNYCHDVLIKDDVVIADSLGGAAAFISAVLDGLSIPSAYVSKVGPDFAYDVNHHPIVSSSLTTLFHAHFSSEPTESRRQDRVLSRVRSCDPILPSDLPDSRFDFGMAVGVAGEILPETLDRMLGLCRVVFVDIQAIIRVFDSEDGTVRLVGLMESGFSHLLPRIGFLKASAEEAPFIDVEEARKLCCVVVTNGKDGCTVYWKDGESHIAPFPTVQVDPTGAGDSFLGGFVAGLVQGLPVPDAALLGNFFGSLTVGHVGFPNFDSRLLQGVLILEVPCLQTELPLLLLLCFLFFLVMPP
ncbi:inositol 3-kinase isoform X2 [Camellia sinensis]|uniref:inositol 3-kinase isoform X2 n=1 Tax=Camellia sinensis TaxID=4442 RepID=UPI001036DF12|nr:inositol 3-kinase isoform X2 [Camellia sinensis]